MNVYELFRERTRNATAFILSPDLEVQFSYDDLDRYSATCASHMRDLGIGPGDRVMVQVAKSPRALFLYFACLRLGAIYLPLNTAYLDEELAYFVSDAEPALIVCDPLKSSYFASLGDHRVITMDAEGYCSLLDGGQAEFTTTALDDSDIAVILYTSGTTGRPKGAMISHGNLAVNGLALHEAWQWRPGDVMLHALPIFHIHGLFVATHLPVLNGSPIIFLPGFDAEQVAALIASDDACRPTVYMGVPTHYTRLTASGKLSPAAAAGMRLFTSGSAPLLEQTFHTFHEQTGHEIVERYGMTETGMNTSNPLDGRRKPGTVGLPLAGVEIRVTDENGLDCTPGEPGDLLVRGDNVFQGYWKLPGKTAAEFTADGFFRTGDIAMLDDDGYVSIVGRNKDMIISGGLNVYPREIEDVIDRIEGVSESAVIGLPHPDFGEGVCAVIVPEQGYELSGNEILAALKNRLANFKIPKWIFFASSLPRNTMGKVQKNLLREQYEREARA